MRRLALLVCLLLFSAGAHADITKTTWQSNPSAGHADTNRIVRFTQSGEQEDFHDSTIIQWPAGTNNFYRYSERYGNNYIYVNSGGTWDGIHVWYSTDLGADGGAGWQHL